MARKKASVPTVPVSITVGNWESVARFLRQLAQDVAVVPNLSSEIVRSSIVVATFLEDRARTVRKELPKEFEAKKESPDETLKKGKKSERVAPRRRA